MSDVVGPVSEGFPLVEVRNTRRARTVCEIRDVPFQSLCFLFKIGEDYTYKRVSRNVRVIFTSI